MKNNYGFYNIDLGEQDFSDADITASLSEETKKTLLELVNKIDKVDEGNVGINTITKIPYIHLIDKSSNMDIRQIGNVYTNDDGLHFTYFNFIANDTQYELSCYLVDTELRVTLTQKVIQFEE